MEKFRYLTWTGSKEKAHGDILADSLQEASRMLKERLGRQEFVIWPWGTPAPMPREPWRG